MRAAGASRPVRSRVAMDMGEITVRLTPRASENRIAGERGGLVLVRVTAPPVDGKANEALCRLIARSLRIGVRSVSIVRGGQSREKHVRVEGLSTEDLRAGLGLSPRP